jgi:hypothetical protein
MVESRLIEHGTVLDQRRQLQLWMVSNGHFEALHFVRSSILRKMQALAQSWLGATGSDQPHAISKHFETVHAISPMVSMLFLISRPEAFRDSYPSEQNKASKRVTDDHD